MKLTVKDLKDKLKNIPDDTLVYIERIEDVYFNKYNWTTTPLVFQRDKNGIVFDSTDIIDASSVTATPNRVIIFAHI